MAPASLGAAYRRFWQEVGEQFPDLGGAASTAYYLENEKRLLTEHVPDLARSAVLKTDLWDEVKNTRILQWVHGQGAAVFGVDISEPTVRQARAAFSDGGLRATVADVRSLPYRDGRFDAIYSMGTIEHFRDPETALREMHRVLRPGGRAVVGVPNRWDPFLRPLLASALQAARLYGYGYERSFSRRALRRMLETAGFEVVELEPLGGLWSTVAVELSYGLQRYRRPWSAPAVDATCRSMQWLASRWERVDRQPKFSWNHLVVGRRPLA